MSSQNLRMNVCSPTWMISGILLFAALAEPHPSYSETIADLSFWKDPGFAERFAESYLAESDIEPTVTNQERDRLQKILSLMAEEKVDDATKALISDLERNEDSSAVLDFTLGNIYFQRDRLEQAVESYNLAVAKHPKFRRAWKNAGLIHIRQGNFQAARDSLTRVVELGGTDALTYGLLGFACTSLEDHLPAESAYRQAVLLDPKTLDWRMGLARTLFKQRRFAEAISLCQNLVAEHPDRSDLWLLQANAHLGMNEPLRAAEVYELVDHLGKSTPETLFTLGDIYINQELYQVAGTSYLRALELNPDTQADRAIRSARVLAARGANPEARALIERIESGATDALEESARKDLLKIRARLAVAEGAGEEEVRVLEEIIELDPLDGDALILLGQNATRTGDIEKAIFYYERAAGIEAFEADAKVRHAQLLVRNGKYAEALPLLRRAQQVKPRDNVQEYLEQVESVAKN